MSWVHEPKQMSQPGFQMEESFIPRNLSLTSRVISSPEPIRHTKKKKKKTITLAWWWPGEKIISCHRSRTSSLLIRHRLTCRFSFSVSAWITRMTTPLVLKSWTNQTSDQMPMIGTVTNWATRPMNFDLPTPGLYRSADTLLDPIDLWRSRRLRSLNMPANTKSGQLMMTLTSRTGTLMSAVMLSSIATRLFVLSEVDGRQRNTGKVKTWMNECKIFLRMIEMIEWSVESSDSWVSLSELVSFCLRPGFSVFSGKSIADGVYMALEALITLTRIFIIERLYQDKLGYIIRSITHAKDWWCWRVLKVFQLPYMLWWALVLGFTIPYWQQCGYQVGQEANACLRSIWW